MLIRGRTCQNISATINKITQTNTKMTSAFWACEQVRQLVQIQRITFGHKNNERAVQRLIQDEEVRKIPAARKSSKLGNCGNILRRQTDAARKFLEPRCILRVSF